MHPILFGEGEWALPSYFTMAMLGFLAATMVARLEARRLRLDATRIVDLAILMMIAGVAGSRFFHVLFDGHLQDYINLCADPSALGLPLPDGSPCASDAACLEAQQGGKDIGAICDAGQCVPARDCLRTLKFWSGGLVWYGGLIFAMPVLWFFTRRKLNTAPDPSDPHAQPPRAISPLAVADLFSPAVALGLAFGRMGCFLSGCCFGGRCELPWAVQFPPGSDAWQEHYEHHYDALAAQYAEGIKASLPVHPTQLYESSGSLLIFLILWLGIRHRRRFDGQMLAWMVILYGVVRGAIEFVRADERGSLAGLSTSQWISVLMIIGGAALLHRGHQRLKRAAEGGPPALTPAPFAAGAGQPAAVVVERDGANAARDDVTEAAAGEEEGSPADSAEEGAALAEESAETSGEDPAEAPDESLAKRSSEES